MKISIVTATHNSELTIRETLHSVLTQTYPNIELIVVDGNSNDNTINIVQSMVTEFKGRLRWISEPDKGIYDAMNKGLLMATGEVVGILNSDDYFSSNDVVEKIALAFDNENINAVYGDVHFIKSNNPEKCVRYYSSARFKPALLRFGVMPAHPSFYMRKWVFNKIGTYRLDYPIGADYEIMVRFFIKYKFKALYIPMDFVTMRLGGVSTSGVQSKIQLVKDNIRACKENGYYTNAFFICMKFFYKITEFKIF